MKINTKVFKVTTPQNPDNWMGKVLTAYLNAGFWLGLGHYIKESSKDVANSEIGPGKMALRTVVRVATFPIEIVESPIRVMKEGVKAIEQMLDEISRDVKTEEKVNDIDDLTEEE